MYGKIKRSDNKLMKHKKKEEKQGTLYELENAFRLSITRYSDIF